MADVTWVTAIGVDWTSVSVRRVAVTSTSSRRTASWADTGAGAKASSEQAPKVASPKAMGKYDLKSFSVIALPRLLLIEFGFPYRAIVNLFVHSAPMYRAFIPRGCFRGLLPPKPGALGAANTARANGAQNRYFGLTSH